MPPKATVAFTDAPSGAGWAPRRSSVTPPKMAVSQAPCRCWAVLTSFGPPNTAVARMTSSADAPLGIVRPAQRATISRPTPMITAGHT